MSSTSGPQALFEVDRGDAKPLGCDCPEGHLAKANQLGIINEPRVGDLGGHIRTLLR